ncbi:hypothetical protein HNQ71_006629 [Mesorhizobium sangaii]|uniref:Uncharacterized protein n=1 Tax=Mesorhizobium sangaii TaxID=505389 RepID=A0A841PTN8_9HYPH|nr:hypothetical protein [Mesorhizobium sangaii]
MAGLGDALFPVDLPALPGRGRKARVGGHLASVVEAPEQALLAPNSAPTSLSFISIAAGAAARSRTSNTSLSASMVLI